MKKRTRHLTLAAIMVLFFILYVPTHAKGQEITNVVSAPSFFNSNTGSTTISYTISDAASSNVILEIYNAGGALVKTIDEGTRDSGTYSAVWDGKDASGAAVPEGSYSVKVSAPSGAATGYRFILKWGSYGDGNGEFKSAQGIVADAFGNVYVAD